jgi:hypothetical protein
MGRIAAHIGATKIFSMQHTAHHGQKNQKHAAHAAHPAMLLKNHTQIWTPAGVHHAHENKGLGFQVDSIWTPGDPRESVKH